MIKPNGTTTKLYPMKLTSGLIEELKKQGHTWMDVQMVTDNVKQLGGTYIPRKEYFERLEQAKKKAKALKF